MSGGDVPRQTPGTDNRVVRVCRLLNRHRARYVIAGGVAANLHGSVRATKDIDILVPRDEANMRRVLAALEKLPYGVARELDASEIARNPITIVGDDPRVDILTVAWTVSFERAWATRVCTPHPGHPRPVPGARSADCVEEDRSAGGRGGHRSAGCRRAREATPEVASTTTPGPLWPSSTSRTGIIGRSPRSTGKVRTDGCSPSPDGHAPASRGLPDGHRDLGVEQLAVGRQDQAGQVIGAR